MPLPADDFLTAYTHYTRHQASPELFHKWCAIAVLGAAMERRTWLTRGYENLRIYPGQLMCVLVGKSAMEKKTTACNFATELLSHLPPHLISIMPEKTSPQRLLHILARTDDEGLPLRYPEDHPWSGRRVNSSGFINAGELAVFFSTDNFNEMLAATINSLNDAPRGKKKLEFMKWQRELWNPIVGMLGAITPKGIAQELPKAARTAGFFGRILWVHSAGGARPNPLTERIHEEKGLKLALRESLTSIANMVGPFVYTKQGQARFESWFNDFYWPHLQRLDVMNLADSTGYWGRKDGHVLRVAMACSASRTLGKEPAPYQLKACDIDRALDLLDGIEKGFPAAMAEIGVGPNTEENARIMGFIEVRGRRHVSRDGWVPQREVMKYSNSLGMRKFHLDDCLARLADADEIEYKYAGGEKMWRRKWSSGSLVQRAMEEKRVEG